MNVCAGATDTTFAEPGKIAGRKEHVKEAFKAGPSDFEYTNNLASPWYPFDFEIAWILRFEYGGLNWKAILKTSVRTFNTGEKNMTSVASTATMLLISILRAKGSAARPMDDETASTRGDISPCKLMQ